jgi:hypothetical protein
VTPAPEPVSDALTVARWKEPYRFTAAPGTEYGKSDLANAETLARLPSWLAECESLMVERGLGEAYGRALSAQLGWDEMANGNLVLIAGSGITSIRTAPLSTVLRALAAVVRAEGEKAK